MEFQKWPKIHSFGHRYNRHIFDGNVQITEKVDGSQFSFGMLGSDLIIRSKEASLYPEDPQSQFAPAVEHVKHLYAANKLVPGRMFYSETLSKPKHNVLHYSRVPLNNIALFGVHIVGLNLWLDYGSLMQYAKQLDIDVVPTFPSSSGYVKAFDGTIDMDYLTSLFKKESFLGGSTIEGIVITDYKATLVDMEGTPPWKAAKMVAPEMAEKHNRRIPRPGSISWGAFKETYHTDARWHKAIQHLRDAGKLTDSVKDIGPIIQEIQRDIKDEDYDIIMEFLWRNFGVDLLRNAIQGFPEFYKNRLTEAARGRRRY